MDLESEELAEEYPISVFCRKYVSVGTSRSLVGLPLEEKHDRAANTFSKVFLNSSFFLVIITSSLSGHFSNMFSPLLSVWCAILRFGHPFLWFTDL